MENLCLMDTHGRLMGWNMSVVMGKLLPLWKGQGDRLSSKEYLLLVATVVPKKDMRLCISHQAIHFAKSQQFSLKDYTLFALTGQFVWGNCWVLIKRAAVSMT